VELCEHLTYMYTKLKYNANKNINLINKVYHEPISQISLTRTTAYGQQFNICFPSYDDQVVML